MQRKIGIDCRMIEYSGIGIRIESILDALLENNKIFEIFLFGAPEQLEKFSSASVRIIEYRAKIYGIRELFGHSKMREMDVIDIPHFNVPLFYIRKCIVTIHDVIPFKMKKYYDSFAKQIYLKIILRLISVFSKKVISVSECTKKDLVEDFHFKVEKIQVIYNGVDTRLFQPAKKKEIAEFQKKYSLPKKYFLTVGIGKEHKNVKFVIQALKKKRENEKTVIPLVIAGSGGKTPEYLEEELRTFKNKVFIFPKIAKEELPLLYSGAYLFIYPSLYEGFGFPAVEAQASGCPVMSSNASVLPEILRTSAYYFNPTDEENFLKTLEKITRSENMRTKYIAKGLANARRFSWKKSVEKILSIYSE